MSALLENLQIPVSCSAGKKYIYTQKESISNEYESS
jgi:hypothetical protein